MKKSLVSLSAVLLGALVFAVGLPAQASNSYNHPYRYGNPNSFRYVNPYTNSYNNDSTNRYNTYYWRSEFKHKNAQRSFSRSPGAKFYEIGTQAFRKHDYAHAIAMWKVSASWASKPAEYSLGVMYFQGNGVPTDRSLGAAWMKLAAERGDPQFVKARDLMVSALTPAQVAGADTLWTGLNETYGDQATLPRAQLAERH